MLHLVCALQNKMVACQLQAKTTKDSDIVKQDRSWYFMDAALNCNLLFDTLLPFNVTKCEKLRIMPIFKMQFIDVEKKKTENVILIYATEEEEYIFQQKKVQRAKFIHK